MPWRRQRWRSRSGSGGDGGGAGSCSATVAGARSAPCWHSRSRVTLCLRRAWLCCWHQLCRTLIVTAHQSVGAAWRRPRVGLSSGGAERYASARGAGQTAENKILHHPAGVGHRQFSHISQAMKGVFIALLLAASVALLLQRPAAVPRFEKVADGVYRRVQSRRARPMHTALRAIWGPCITSLLRVCAG